MKHVMHLHKEPFALIISGKKSIELRLNDEKRKEIIVGDQIEFIKKDSSEKIMKTVSKITKAGSFFELFLSIKISKLGRPDFTAGDFVEKMYEYYSQSDEEKFGVVAFELI